MPPKLQKHITVLIKPASDLCQLSCAYCFYRELARGSSHRLMTSDTAQKLLFRIKEFGATHVQFAFQGGEPLLWGVDNLKAFCQSVKESGLHATYAIQTNGMALNENFCQLFKTYDFLVGLSMDGDQNLHDAHRQDSLGHGSFRQVKSALAQLKKHNIRHNILSVITQNSAKHPTDLYRFYKRLGVSYVQLIPCLPPMTPHATCECYTPTPSQYATFLKAFYKLWREDFVGGQPPFFVREFDQCLSILQNRGGFCGAGGVCTPQLIVESDGSLYPCDFYVLPAYQTGHLDTTPIADTLTSQGMRHFAQDHPTRLPLCQTCPYALPCGGGCRRMRDVYLADQKLCPLQALLDFMLSKK